MFKLSSVKLCLTLFCYSRSNWYDDDGNNWKP